MSGDVVLHDPSTVSECIEELTSDMGDSSKCYVWRGQADYTWNPYPGLYRRLLNSGYQENQIDERLVSQYERDILCEANGLGFYGEAGGNRLDLMVRLQHAGGATRLLDVTWDPFVALWFSSGGAKDLNGIVYRYAIDRRFHAQPESIQSWDDITGAKLCGAPTLYSPRVLNKRIAAQSAAFLTTVLAQPLSEGTIFSQMTAFSTIKKVLVSSQLKAGVRDYLRYSRGVRNTDMFPDFDGFAQAHGQGAPFPRDRGELYGIGSMELFPNRFAPFG